MNPSLVRRSIGMLASCSLLVASSARGDDRRAHGAFEEGLRLLDLKQDEAACAKFRESQAVEPSVGALLNIAMCSTRENKLARAAEEYRALLLLNEATVDPERRRNVDARARQAMRSLALRVPTLELDVTPAPATLAIVLDGKPFERSRLGSAEPVDPGEHVIKVTAQGFRPLEARVVLREGERRAEALALVPVSEGAVDSGRDARALAGWITGAAGLAGAVTGAALLGVAGLRAGEIEDLCGEDATPPVCSPSQNAPAATRLSDEGRAFEVGGWVSLGVGAALVATGAVLLGTSLADEGRIGLAPFGPSGPGLTLLVRF